MRFDAFPPHLMFQPRIAILLLLACYHTCSAHHDNGPQDHIKSHITDDGRLHIHGPHSLMEQLSVEPAGAEPPLNADFFDQPSEQEVPLLGSFIGIGNPVMVPQNPQEEISRKRKRDCLPSVSTRSYFANTIKRSPYLAATVQEMQAKRQSDTAEQHRLRKRSAEDTLLPWTCETQYEWRDMGAESYPRFVRTAECKTKYCVRGFYRCTPRKYKTKILKRNNGGATNGDGSCEEDDTSLPESLRNNWKFVTVTINLCCDCTGPGRVPTSDD